MKSGAEIIFKAIMAEFFWDFTKNTNTMIQEDEQNSSKMNLKKIPPCYIKIKLTKINDKKNMYEKPDE